MDKAMKRTAVFLSFLLATAAPMEPSLAAPYQAGVTTEDDVSFGLGQPDSVTLQPDGSFVYVYRIEDSSAFLDMFPILGLIVPLGSTTLTFTFDASTRLTNYAAD